MNIFITTGTLDFLKKIENKYPMETLVTMANVSGALLLHETNGKTIFNVPRGYEVLDTAGEIKDKGFVVMNNIPVTDEGRPLFEQEYKNRAQSLSKDAGFIAARVLRPMKSNTYVTLTIWENESDFQNSKNLNNFSEILDQKELGIDTGSKPYTTQYTIVD
jgi:heme oxygenase (mycobilin-producing)